MKYEAKVKYTKLNDVSGKEQVVSESFIVDNAETFSDAEKQTVEYMAERTSSTVMAAIKISDIEDIITGVGDWYYKAKIVSTTLDELSGKEKSIMVTLLIQKDNINGSMMECEDWMNQSLFDCELTSISKTKIVDII